jgi:hypothetical protein
MKFVDPEGFRQTVAPPMRLALLALFWPERDTARGTSASAIAVLPFSNRGSPAYTYLGKGMVDLLSVKLEGVTGVRSVHAIASPAGAMRKSSFEVTIVGEAEVFDVADRLVATTRPRMVPDPWSTTSSTPLPPSYAWARSLSGRGDRRALSSTTPGAWCFGPMPIRSSNR